MSIFSLTHSISPLLKLMEPNLRAFIVSYVPYLGYAIRYGTGASLLHELYLLYFTPPMALIAAEIGLPDRVFYPMIGPQPGNFSAGNINMYLTESSTNQ